MKIMSLCSAVAIATLAAAAPAFAGEPSSIGAYKAEVVKLVNKWAGAMDLYVPHWTDLLKKGKEQVLAEVKPGESRRKYQGKVDDLERDKQQLELRNKQLHEGLEETKKQANNSKAGLKSRGEAVQRGFQIADDIKEIEKQIVKNAGDMQLAQADLKTAKELDDLLIREIKDIENQWADTKAGLLTVSQVLRQDLLSLQSPAKKDLKNVLDKDPATKRFRVEWGPLLAKFINEQIKSKAKTGLADVSIRANWSQDAFALGASPNIEVTVSTPNLPF